jgi:hypothetical protein
MGFEPNEMGVKKVKWFELEYRLLLRERCFVVQTKKTPIFRLAFGINKMLQQRNALALMGAASFL